MAWYVGSIRVFVQDEVETAKQIIARLNPLGGGTVYHTFGYENEIFKLTGYVVGSGEIETLKGYTTDGNTHVLASPFLGNKNHYVNTVVARPGNYICQRLDLTKDELEPVYVVDVELYKA